MLVECADSFVWFCAGSVLASNTINGLVSPAPFRQQVLRAPKIGLVVEGAKLSNLAKQTDEELSKADQKVKAASAASVKARAQNMSEAQTRLAAAQQELELAKAKKDVVDAAVLTSHRASRRIGPCFVCMLLTHSVFMCG